jgi:hypothetical protein
MKNETSITNIFRPCSAGRRVDVFLGLKPQAQSYCPFGAKNCRAAVQRVAMSKPCFAVNFAAFHLATLTLSSAQGARDCRPRANQRISPDNRTQALPPIYR